MRHSSLSSFKKTFPKQTERQPFPLESPGSRRVAGRELTAGGDVGCLRGEGLGDMLRQ